MVQRLMFRVLLSAYLVLIAGCSDRIWINQHSATVTIQCITAAERWEQQRKANSDPMRLSLGCPRPTEDLTVQVNILESRRILEDVAGRIIDNNYLEAFGGDVPMGQRRDFEDILEANRHVTKSLERLQLQLEFRHRDPKVAAVVANFFADALLDYDDALHLKGAERAAVDLEQRAEKQIERIRQIESKMTRFESEHGASTELDLRINRLKSQLTLASAEGRAEDVVKLNSEIEALTQNYSRHTSLLREYEVQKGFYDALVERADDEREWLRQPKGMRGQFRIVQRADESASVR